MKPGFELMDGDEGSIALTSIIDVLFVLLTFFILAATFTAPSIEVTLSEAESAAAVSSQTERVTFSIYSDGLLSHETKVIRQEDIPLILEGMEKDIAIIFNVDKASPFESFLGVLDKVKSGGYSNFHINAEYKGE